MDKIRTVWLMDLVDLIDRPDIHTIICHGKTFTLVKHAHWEKDGTCSVCGKKAIKKIIFDDEMLWEDEYDYCPHCGAKMDEVVK